LKYSKVKATTVSMCLQIYSHITSIPNSVASEEDVAVLDLLSRYERMDLKLNRYEEGPAHGTLNQELAWGRISAK
jgi:hypothetical protein